MGGRLAAGARVAPGALWARADDPGPRFDPDLDVKLTARELAVLDLMADGLIARAIAHRLGISPRTVGKHIENIYRKLDAHDRVNAVLRAQARGLLRSSW